MPTPCPVSANTTLAPPATRDGVQPSPFSWRETGWISAVLFAAVFIAYVGVVPMPRSDGFIPAVQAIIAAIDFITAVLLFAFDGHAFPIDDEILAYLKEQEVVEDGVNLEEAQRFVEHHLKAEECHDLFAAARKVVSDESGRSRKKAKA